MLFASNDIALHEQGVNRVGNLFISSESYCNFENTMLPIFDKLYAIKPRWTPSEMFREIGLLLEDESTGLADLQDFVKKTIKLQVEPSYEQEEFDVVLM